MQTNNVSHTGFADLLQGQPLHCIPTIYQDETLYSWCARYHRISGSISAASTSQRLFGSKTSGFVVDFPGRLEYFSSVTASIFGTPTQIIRNHTLYPLYSAFRPPQTMAKIENLMLGNSVERVKFILGLPASRAATSHPLKFCRSCAQDEIIERGIASWWRDHQWPTVWICTKHQRVLEYIHASYGGHKLTAWLTPDSLHDSDHIWHPRISENNLPDIERLSRITLEIAKKNEYFRPEIMRLIFTLKLRKNGWIIPSGMLDWPGILDSFIARYCELEELPGFGFIRDIRGDSAGILGPMLRGSKRIQHPTKYLLLINLLFETPKHFFDLYHEHASNDQPEKYTDHLKHVDANTLNSSLTTLVVGKGTSLNQAAQLLGISVQRVISWAKKNKIEYKKRPRKNGQDFQLLLNQLLEVGAPREVISQTLSVSRKWITAYLARHPVHKEEWEVATLNSATRARRAELVKILAHHPGANQKAICSIPGNPFQWLRRNDPVWLEENLPFFNIKKRHQEIV